MKPGKLIATVRKYAKIGYRYGVDPDEVESRAIEQLLGVDLDAKQPNPNGYIYVTVRNAALQIYNKEKRRATPVPEFYDNIVGGRRDRNEYDGLIPRVREYVKAVLGSVDDERRREAAVAYYLEGLSTPQIGELMGIPKGTVGRLLYEARGQLKKDEVADLKVWDDFNRPPTRGNQGYDEGASERLLNLLRREGFLR